MYIYGTVILMPSPSIETLLGGMDCNELHLDDVKMGNGHLSHQVSNT